MNPESRDTWLDKLSYFKYYLIRNCTKTFTKEKGVVMIIKTIFTILSLFLLIVVFIDLRNYKKALLEEWYILSVENRKNVTRDFNRSSFYFIVCILLMVLIIAVSFIEYAVSSSYSLPILAIGISAVMGTISTGGKLHFIAEDKKPIK